MILHNYRVLITCTDNGRLSYWPDEGEKVSVFSQSVVYATIHTFVITILLLDYVSVVIVLQLV